MFLLIHSLSTLYDVILSGVEGQNNDLSLLAVPIAIGTKHMREKEGKIQCVLFEEVNLIFLLRKNISQVLATDY